MTIPCFTFNLLLFVVRKKKKNATDKEERKMMRKKQKKNYFEALTFIVVTCNTISLTRQLKKKKNFSFLYSRLILKQDY